MKSNSLSFFDGTADEKLDIRRCEGSPPPAPGLAAFHTSYLTDNKCQVVKLGLIEVWGRSRFVRVRHEKSKSTNEYLGCVLLSVQNRYRRTPLQRWQLAGIVSLCGFIRTTGSLHILLTSPREHYKIGAQEKMVLIFDPQLVEG